LPPEGLRDRETPHRPTRQQRARNSSWQAAKDAHDAAGSVQHFQGDCVVPQYAEAISSRRRHLEAANSGSRAGLQKSTEIEPNLSTGTSPWSLPNLMAKYAKLNCPLRGIELDPEAADGHYELAKTTGCPGVYQDAETHACEGGKLAGQTWQGRTFVGRIDSDKARRAGALKEYKEALRRPQAPWLHPHR